MILTSADPNIKNFKGLSPLQSAVECFQKEAVRFAIGYNQRLTITNSKLKAFDFNVCSRMYGSLLHQACRIPSLNIICLLGECSASNALLLDDQCQTGSSIVESCYLSSKKLSFKLEVDAMIKYIRLPIDVSCPTRQKITKARQMLFGQCVNENGISGNMRDRMALKEMLQISSIKKTVRSGAALNRSIRIDRLISNRDNSFCDELDLPTQPPTNKIAEFNLVSRTSSNRNIRTLSSYTRNNDEITVNRIKLAKKPPMQPKVINLDWLMSPASAIEGIDDSVIDSNLKSTNESPINGAFKHLIQDYSKFEIHTSYTPKRAKIFEPLLLKVLNQIELHFKKLNGLISSGLTGTGLTEDSIYQIHDKIRQLHMIIRAYDYEKLRYVLEINEHLAMSIAKCSNLAASILVFVLKNDAIGGTILYACSEFLSLIQKSKSLSSEITDLIQNTLSIIWTLKTFKARSFLASCTLAYSISSKAPVIPLPTKNNVQSRSLSRNVSRDLITPDASSISINVSMRNPSLRHRQRSESNKTVKITTPTMRRSAIRPKMI